ncbi:Stk1 family PASTA domain-containing Ser/Thr kinase [Methanosarcina mazei]|uniref:Serine/threonine protein kinase n=2 Tax=Methanosarcina mazei TaxID=2209 RepID=A0A0F8HZZ4_METMZ|nr:PASTA domain-containing protein [Methanosarcina mazei]AKB41511.1 Serine/threonine protein kinase PrkC, regulator of stationary phase [Methanosarcina mazei WWM610]KKG72679.1 serine/threonine protein kinase [Methanosarcina mazei]KKH60931.1 serine/threonine protein kinase [Methanosarcina mazei]
MTNLSDIRSSLEAFRKAGTIDSGSYANLVAKLNNTEIEFQSIQKEALVYKENLDTLLAGKLVLEREKSSLAAQVTKLSNEKVELESRISILQKSRPVLSSSNLVSSFASSLVEMDKGLKKVQSGSKYLVSNMNVTLKTNIALEGGELRFQLPKADDIISPENLSTIEFSLRTSPEKPGIDSYVEVPDLVGLSKEEAERKLLESGFKVGDVLEIESSKPQGTVLAQLPLEGSLAEPGAEVDLTVSRFLSVKVPDLVGLGLEASKVLLEKSRLRLEGVKEQPSDKDPGIVLAQSLSPGSEVEVNSAVVLTVSIKVYRVPNLLGLELESAKKVIEKSGLQPGEVKERFSSGKSGIVLAQSLKPGLEVEANSKVDLVVSTGEKEVVIEKPLRTIPETVVKETIPEVSLNTPVKLQPETVTKESRETAASTSAETSRQNYKLVPSVTGMSLEKAGALLGAQGIKVGTVSEVISTGAAGIVISQSPGAGSTVNLSVPVNLVVSKKAPETQLRSSTLSRIKL